jgi:DNA-binding SARP family transcriptional activator
MQHRLCRERNTSQARKYGVFKAVIPILHIHLLGDFLVVSDDTPVTTVSVPRLQSLLAYLVLHRNAPQDRSHLAFLLWPDSTEAQAHTNLRKLLYQLRQALPDIDHFLHANKHSLQWLPARSDASWTLDVLDVEQALAQAEQAKRVQDTTATRQALEQVMHLYRGDLLPNCYDEWILPERDRLHQMFLQAAEQLITLLEQERDYNDAIMAAQQLLRQDPLHETTYRQLMRLYALRGDRAAALRVYHTCVTVLERELGTEPGEAMREVYESLLQSNTSSEMLTGPLASRGTEAPLIGRKAEWRQLQETWRKAAGGQPHIVILSGEAGIGKTRLAEEMEAWVSRQGMTAASARCYAALGRLAYAPVTAWLRADAIQSGLSTLDPVWLTEITRLVPEVLVKRPKLPRPTSMTEGWQRQHFFEALARAVLSARQPLLLLLDDLQWCDDETLEWLHYLLRFEPGTRLLLIGTVRSEETLPGHPLVAFLGALQRDGLVTEVTLGPLTTTETTSLAQHTMGRHLDPAMLNMLYHETEGNPLFVVEMVRAETLGQRGRAQPVAESPLPLLTHPASTLPPSVQSVLATRLAQLSPLAREVANVAAVIGREFTFSVLARASGESEDAVVRGLDELWQRRIVREQGAGTAETYDFSHDKLRELAYDSLSPAHQHLLHRRVAEALVEVYADDQDAISGQIAAHYERAGLLGQAIPYYLHAGKVASRVYANAEAITAFQRAIILLETHSAGLSRRSKQSEEAASLYEHLGDVFERIGQHGEARQAYQQAMAHVPAQGCVWLARLHRKTAKTWNFPPNPEEVLRACREAERILERERRAYVERGTSQHSDAGGAAVKSGTEWQQEWIQTQIEQLHPLFMSARMQEMAHVIEKARPVIEQYGTSAQRAIFFHNVALSEAMQSHYVVLEETLSYSRKALEASLESGRLDLIGFVRFGLGVCLLWYGDLDRADEQLHTAVALAEQIGDIELLARSLAFLPFVPRHRGQVEEVRRAISRAWTQEKRYDEVIIGHRSWAAWREGNMEEAEADGLAALESWRHKRHIYAFQWTALWPLIGVALTQDRFLEAINYVRMLLDPTQQYPPETLLAMLEECLQAWDAGQQDTARALLQRAVPLAREMNYL